MTTTAHPTSTHGSRGPVRAVSAGVVLLAVLASVEPLAAQNRGRNRAQTPPQSGFQWPEAGGRGAGSPGGAPGQDFTILRRVLQSGQETPIGEVTPFPSFPLSLPGFGAYPTLGLPTPFAGAQPDLPLLGAMPAPDPNAWPSWIASDDSVDAAEGFTAARAIVSRTADRVWYLGPRAGAYVPLAFHDKIRLVTEGARVRVDNKGSFDVLLQEGAKLRSSGPVELRFDALTEEAVDLALVAFSRVWLDARTRPIRVSLPSGELVVVTSARAYLEHDGRTAVVENAGGVSVVLQSAIGEQPIPPAHRAAVLAAAERTGGVPAALAVAGDVRSQESGRILSGEGGAAGGTVVWNGARFAVPPGGTLEIDPLAGAAFPSHRTETQ